MRCVATARPGIEAETLLEAIDGHLEACRQRPPKAGDLDRALNRLLTDHHDQLQLLDRRADLLSLYTTYFDQPGLLNDEPARYAAIGGAQVQDFAARHLRPERRVVLTLAPSAEGEDR